MASKFSKVQKQQLKQMIDTSVKETRNKRRGNRRRRKLRNRRIPAAFSSSTSTFARIQQRQGTAILTLREVFPITYHELQPVDWMLPGNPTKWTNTRASVLASTYTGFRPKRVSVSFQPVLSTSTSGTVAFGTSFDGVTPTIGGKDQAVTAFPTTNGGFITSVWKPHTSRIACGTSLRANLYPLASIDQDDIPFWFYVSVNSSSLTNDSHAGNLIITATIILHNPATAPVNTANANNVPVTVVHTDATEQSPASTVARVASSVLNGFPIRQGRDYNFYFNTPIYNATSAERISNLGTPVFSNSFTEHDGVLDFLIDSAISSIAQTFCTILPSSPNF
jgi:hypothetical protein